MKSYLFFFLLIFLKALNVSGQDTNLQGIRIDNHFDIFYQMPQSVAYNNSSFLYFSNDYWILQMPVEKFQTERRKINGRDSLLRTKIGTFYRSYIAERGVRIGLVYDSLTAPKPKAIYPVDSVIIDELMSPKQFYPQTDTLARLDRIDDSKTEVIERYKIIKPKPGKPDSLYYYFSKQRMPMSFVNPSKKNDSLSLYRFEGIIAGKHIETPSYKGPLPRKKWSFEITVVDVQNKAEIFKIIERFRHDKIIYIKPKVLRQ